MRGNLDKYVVFVLSPFLSLPLILWDTLNKSKGSLVLLTILLSLLSYLYVPGEDDDKFYYINLYSQFRSYSLAQFLGFIFLGATDFLFYYFIYLFAQAGLPIGLLFFSMTFITVGIAIYIFDKILSRYEMSGKRYLLFLAVFLLSYSLVNLLSGIRFYFASSFLLLGFYSGVFKERKAISFLYFIIAAATHFSTLFYLPFYILFLIFRKAKSVLRVLFFVSFIFIFIPGNFLIMSLDSVGVGGIYKAKAQNYLGEEKDDMTEKSIKTGNANNTIKMVIDNIWLLVAYVFLYFKKDDGSPFKMMLLVVLALNHLFFLAPDAFFRYSIISKLFLLMMLVSVEWKVKTPKYTYVFLLLFGMSFLFNLIALRTRLIDSFSDPRSYSLVTLFLEE